ncbi:MAG: aminotransferase class IV family protein [Alphaproteobacteria bacterium]|nr:aminotransferase class IV family protein [Alphaproteobacteria bacterium]
MLTQATTFSDIVFINGYFKPRSEAAVSINDRGFRFGDGIFETIRVSQGALYLWSYHFQRLSLGLKAIKMVALEEQSLKSLCQQIIDKNHLIDGIIRLAITRGEGSAGYRPLTDGSQPTIVIETRPLPHVSQTLLSVWLSRYVRISPSSLPMHAKMMQGMQSTLALLEAQEQGCQEALMLDGNGHISECAAANIFWIKDDILFTPSLKTGCLAGVIRRRVMELSPYPVKEIEADISQLEQARSVFLTNVGWPVVPVSRIVSQSLIFHDVSVAQHFRTLLEKDMIS